MYINEKECVCERNEHVTGTSTGWSLSRKYCTCCGGFYSVITGPSSDSGTSQHKLPQPKCRGKCKEKVNPKIKKILERSMIEDKELWEELAGLEKASLQDLANFEKKLEDDNEPDAPQ